MDMNEILEWLSADWWNGLGVILAIVGVPSLFAGIRYVVRKVRHTDDEETKPISNEQIDAMFPTTTSATPKLHEHMEQPSWKNRQQTMGAVRHSFLQH